MDWAEGLPWLLLAVREVMQEGTGFNQNDVIFSHKLHRVLSVLHELSIITDPLANLVTCVSGFMERPH